MSTTPVTSSAATEKAPDAAGGLDRKVLLVAGVVVLGAIMSILDVTVVSVAQNTFQNEFGTDAAGAAWTMTGYTLALAAVIPLSSWAVARFGARNVYLTSLVLFTIGSALCAMASSIGMLVAFRVIQGLGGGLLMPVGMMILTKAAGPERVGSVMAVLGIPMLLGPIAGPILGGLLIETASWHWVFLINVPVGIIAFIYSWIILRDKEETSRPSIDIIGLLLLSPGLAAFLYGISTSAEEGTFIAAKVLIPAAIGLVLILAFIAHALRSKSPLLDLRLFGNKTLSISVVSMTLFMIAFFGASLLYPQYFIGIRGESTLAAGLLLAPQGLGAMLTMPIAGRLTDKMGPGKFVLGGLVLIVAGVGTFTFLGADSSYWLLCGALFVQGLGMGMTMMPIMSAALATLKSEQVPDGSTLVNVVQQTASSIGTAIISVLLASNLAAHAESKLAIASNAAPEEYDKLVAAGQAPAEVPTQWLDWGASAFAGAFVVSAVLIAVTFVPAFFLPRKRVAGAESAPVMMH
ncbi:DHA2 family efflux MFS transporter permease subunit [Gordonia amarae]|uniref:DHA2 family efflux MFS transporter permease subunit n=2 Tax=Gordonia amarae TaxID=36821 RepID=A0A857MAI4_9ACTN|nr:DHA2 family efflux MFS transporter permease subunit [Gordonia amarae]MCS3877373.1 EmrB/QacA subfamily drug resistance transporter [Gordonia amarae]QHN16125.1 DHA2 family efflux MFS transporter permease subunit [Gordonia amarae]QHN20693.1 DHA2 family efflux MFS transporter permease subunit [Gordonia amarae]QHN29545.1 DHA2 family efflux MFS transporter permease subunit [Gordonia amarae]QHN38321.1 DHA2 family efflux MFS transporter permease subunit [Gordonia amarae]